MSTLPCGATTTGKSAKASSVRRPRKQLRLRLPSAVPQRLRAALPRPAAQLPARRLLHRALQSLSWAADLLPLRRTAQQVGYLNELRADHSARPQGLRRPDADNGRPNLTLAYPFLGPLTATVQPYVFNLFNNQIATTRGHRLVGNPPPDYPASLYDPNQQQTNADYGKITTRQDPRLFRAAVKLSF